MTLLTTGTRYVKRRRHQVIKLLDGEPLVSTLKVNTTLYRSDGKDLCRRA